MIKQLIIFIADLYASRRLIFQLTVSDFKAKYLGSYLGLLWAFIQPLITVLILWFVFQVGFRSVPVSNCPFILWLIAGIIPWFFFADAVSNTTNSVLGYSYLVKKIVFRVSILPVIKILSALLIHLFFVGVLIGFFLVFNYPFSLHVIQIPYYLGALMVLIMGISYFTASVVVFLRDISQLVSMFLQFGFWGTPIFWSLNMIPAKYQFFLKLNPVFYIVNGYRDALIYKKWFWESWELTIYFWGITLLIFAAGATIFKRLRPHFADIL